VLVLTLALVILLDFDCCIPEADQQGHDASQYAPDGDELEGMVGRGFGIGNWLWFSVSVLVFLAGSFSALVILYL
jgi:hypothetical protein